MVSRVARTLTRTYNERGGLLLIKCFHLNRNFQLLCDDSINAEALITNTDLKIAYILCLRNTVLHILSILPHVFYNDITRYNNQCKNVLNLPV